jgi:flagellar hook assembly protein FlgD
LTVHDLSGRLVRVLYEGQRSAGEFSVSWDGTDIGGGPVGSGVYLYRLEAAGKVEQRKMTLIR